MAVAGAALLLPVLLPELRTKSGLEGILFLEGTNDESSHYLADLACQNATAVEPSFLRPAPATSSSEASPKITFT